MGYSDCLLTKIYKYCEGRRDTSDELAEKHKAVTECLEVTKTFPLQRLQRNLGVLELGDTRQDQFQELICVSGSFLSLF